MNKVDELEASRDRWKQQYELEEKETSALHDRIAELEAEVSYLQTRDKSQGAYIEQVLDELEAENERLRGALKWISANVKVAAERALAEKDDE